MSSVLVVADDLMWSTRLLSFAAGAGAAGRTVPDLAGLRAALRTEPPDQPPDLVIVDLSARSFDAVAAVSEAAGAGGRVIAIAQHEVDAVPKSFRETRDFSCAAVRH